MMVESISDVIGNHHDKVLGISHLHWGGESPSNSRVKGPNQDIKNYKPSHPDRHKSGTWLSRYRGKLNEKKVSERKIIKKTSLGRSV